MPSRPLRTLVVEDSEADTQLLILHLTRGGYQPCVTRVETPQDMSRLLDEQTWDLVIADYSLPRFNAVQALNVLREKDVDIPFIILSGTIGEETAVAAMKAGAHDYIMKGSSARLIPAIERELREVQERATRRKAEEELRENEHRFRSLIEHASDITTVVDREATISYLSPSVERLLGYVPSELVGRSLHRYIHPDDVAAVRSAVVRPAHEGIQSVEFRFQDRVGAWRSLEATVNNLLDNPDVGGIVLNCRDITSRKQDEETIRHLAYYDALTNLPNRILFNDRLHQELAHARRRGAPGLAVMFLDLDRFKTINDTLGHGAGDALLRGTAERLTRLLREGDTMARLGGDEFLFLLPGVDNVEDSVRIAQKILDAFRAPFQVQEQEFHVTATVGISLFPMDGDEGESLIRKADMALYRAKEQGRNRYQLYAEAMNAIAFERLVLENNLRRALERGEFRLFYQPIVSAANGAVVGVEALIRWMHPELGLVPPMKFIPMAEETGLIVPLTLWVLETACAQMKEWQRLGIPPLTVAVNVSALRFNDANIPKTIATILESVDLEGRFLTVELTESIMVDNAEATIRTLHQLKELGIKISIDDFGTGYSSLSYLKRLPIDTLKIDQSFVRDIPSDTDNSAIAALIITMAHNLKLSVVAEGVETQDQLSFLRSKGCDTIQGFLISKPLPLAELMEFFRTHRASVQ